MVDTGKAAGKVPDTGRIGEDADVGAVAGVGEAGGRIRVSIQARHGFVAVIAWVIVRVVLRPLWDADVFGLGARGLVVGACW